MKNLLFMMLLGLIVLGNACSAPAPTRAPSPTNAPAPTQAVSQPTNVPDATDVPVQPSTVPTVPQSGGSVEPPSGNPFDVISNAFLAQLQAKSFRATTNIEPASGDPSQFIIEYLAPDRLHVITDGEEQIAIKGKGVWSKEGDTWEEAPSGFAEILFAALTPESVQKTLKTVQVNSIRFVGVEQLDGKPMFVYEYESVVDAGGGNSIQGKSKVWIGATDRRTYRVEAVADSASKPGAQDKTTVTYEYDIPLTIEAPI